METSYNIFPIGNNALTVDFGAGISKEPNDRVISLSNHLSSQPVKGILDIIPAYSSLTIVYDAIAIRQSCKTALTIFDWLKGNIGQRLRNMTHVQGNIRQVSVPVCYHSTLGPDLEYIALQHRLTIPEVVQIHHSQTYRVYMIGFLPGFAYMASVDERIATGRKEQPRKTVPAGSVGIAGKQTGIYPLSSPGGWQLIGQTPLALFSAAREDPAFFQPGDEVQFYPIGLNEFYKLKHNNEPSDS